MFFNDVSPICILCECFSIQLIRAKLWIGKGNQGFEGERNMLIKNVHLSGREGLWQILCQDGLIRTIAPMSQILLSTRELDGEEGMAMAPLSSLIFTSIPPRPPVSRAGTSPVPCSRG